MRVGIIGIGDIATKAYLPLLASWPSITLVLCSRNKDSVTKAQIKYGITEAYCEYTLLLDKKIDAVMIHTATESHFEITKYFLENKIPVFVDKPLSSDICQVRELCDLALNVNTPIFIGFNRRYAPHYSGIFNTSPNEVTYQKNRQNLPGEIREFIYDDFIHVVDTVLKFDKDKKEKQNLTVHGVFKSGLLSSVQVSWQTEAAIYTAKMNRNAGYTGEKLSVVENNQNWTVNNLMSGECRTGREVALIEEAPWSHHLEARGFRKMIEFFFDNVNKCANHKLLNSYRQTHEMCESIVLALINKY